MCNFAPALTWVRELAEYSGAEVHRAGFATGGSVGLRWKTTSRLSVRVEGGLSAATLGAAALEGVTGATQGSLARYGRLSGGVDLRLGG